MIGTARSTLSLTFIVLLIVGCSAKDVERLPHQDKPETASVYDDAPAEVQTKMDEDIQDVYANRLKYHDIIHRDPAPSSEILKARVIRPLSKYILDNTYLRSSRWSGSDELNEVLNIFNTAFAIVLQNEKPMSKEISDITMRYQTVLFDSCMKNTDGIDISRGCYNLATFIRDSETNAVLVQIAANMSESVKQLRATYKAQSAKSKTGCVSEECTGSKQKYMQSTLQLFNLLKVAHMNVSTRINQSAVLLWQEHAEDNHFYYAQNQRPMDKWQKYLNCQIFAESTTDVSQAVSSSPEVRSRYFALLDRLKPFDDRSEDVFCAKNFKTLKEDWFKHRLFANGKLDPTGALTEFIRSSQEVRPDYDPKSQSLTYSEKIDFLKTNPYFFSGLKLTSLQPDIFFYIIDEVAHNRLSKETGALIWNQILSQDTSVSREEKLKRLYKTTRNYLQTNIATLSAQTNTHFKSFFEGKEFSSKDIFSLFINHASLLKDPWGKVKDKNTRLQNFLNEAVAKNLPEFGDDRDKFNEELIALKGLQEMVNIQSVGPHKLMLAYFLAKFKGTVSYYVWWLRRTVDLQLEDLISSVLEGTIDVWFDYGDPNARISAYQMFHVFDFWLRTDVLSSYSEVSEVLDGETVSIVSEESFFDFIVEKYIYKQRGLVDKALEKLNTFDDSTVKTFIDHCAVDFDIYQEISMDTLEDRALITSDAQFVRNMLYPNEAGSLSNALDAIRNEFEPRFRTVEVFLQILKNYKEHPPVKLAQIADAAKKQREEARRASLDQAIISLEKKVVDLRVRRELLLSKSVEYFNSFFVEGPNGRINCAKKLVDAELDRKFSAASMEIEYLNDVHAVMTILQASKALGDAASKEQILEKVAQMDLGEDKADVLARSRAFFDIYNPQSTTLAQLTLVAEKNFVINNIESESRVFAKGLTFRDFGNGTTNSLQPYNFAGEGKLEPDKFYQHPVDLRLRMRLFLNDGYTNLLDQKYEPMATQLNLKLEEDFPTWKLRKQVAQDYPYSSNRKRFVKDNLRTMGGGFGSYLTWFTPLRGALPFNIDKTGFGAEIVNLQVYLARTLMRHNALPVSRFMDVFDDLADTLTMSDYEAPFFQLFDQPGKIESAMVSRYFLETAEADSTYYQNLFQAVNDYQKDDLVVKLESYFQDEIDLMFTKDSFELRPDLMLFPFSLLSVQAIRDQLRPMVLDFFVGRLKFIAEIKHRELVDKSEPKELILENNLNTTIPQSDVIKSREGFKVLVPKTRTDGTLIYLPQRVIDDFEKSFVDFHNEKTDCTLLPRAANTSLGLKADPDIQLYRLDISAIEAKKTCKSRAKEYYRQLKESIL